MVGIPQRGHTTLEHRLSQPESKKARKRRRKAERQASEDARLQNLNWLNGPSPFASGVPILPLRSWSNDVQVYGGLPPPQSTDRPSLMPGLISGFPSPFTAPPEPDDFTLYDNHEPHSASPPPPPSHWVSSMAKAASDSLDLTTEEHELSQWSPLSTQIPLLPLPPLSSSLPPSLPSCATTTPTPNNLSRSKISTLPKPAEYHALPPKPPPQTIQATIGMKPDPEPNSKHGIFRLASATKEAGTNMKKKSSLYMPNPARTLVMEQLPKTHRHPDFVNNWSKSACGALPVHMFIDSPAGKALIEFATAELARKAWASPKLGSAHSHQVKGKPREDLIRVWWYRVDGVGAGSGVGEIEEGEIVGDAIEKEPDQPPRKETKKERKARIAKEREEKRVKRELELRLMKERHALLRVELPTTSSAVPEISYQRASTPVMRSSLWPRPVLSPPRASTPGWQTSPRPGFSTSVWRTPPRPGVSTPGWQTPGWQTPPQPGVSTPVFSSPPWSPQVPDHHLRNASEPGNGSSIWARPWSSEDLGESLGPSAWTEGDDLDDYECMEIDEPPLSYPTGRPAIQPLPLHSSLPPRPASTIVSPHPRAAVQKAPPSTPALLPLKVLPSSRPVYEDPPPQAAPLPPPPPLALASSSSSTPCEPRAMKNAPTEPSFTKRALEARQKELEERIAKSKLELAETRAAAGPTTKAATPVMSVQPDNPIPVKPSMDLGEKQAMEDRLRKLVLKSQRERGRAAVLPDNGACSASATTTPSSSGCPSISPSISPSDSSTSSSTSSVPSPVASDQLTSVLLSAHNFSLEDLAVSFITQTIETIKSKPTPTPIKPPAISTHPSNKTTAQSNNTNTKLELAAKQKRLEQHIAESKKLMNKLGQARSKEEKDVILKAMREMTRCVFISPISLVVRLPIGLN